LILICSLAILLIIGDITIQEKIIFLSLGWILSGFSGGILFTSLTYYSQVLSPKRRGVLAGSLTAGYFTGIALVPMTLAPFSNVFGINGVYIAIMVVSIIFIVVIMLLYFFTRSSVSDKKKDPH